MKNADMPAMPNTTWDNDVDKVVDQSNGLTKREHFAAMAMQGMMANSMALYDAVPTGTVLADFISEQSVAMADALLAALEETHQ